MDHDRRTYPIGAEVLSGGVHFRVWSPAAEKVEVVFEGLDQGAGEDNRSYMLEPEGNGYFSALVRDASAGALYRFRLNEESPCYPDPASRFQPNGPHGPSEVIDPQRFTWTDTDWKGVSADGQVIYEMHIGTFTQGGTWDSAAKELGALAETGITILEIMPVADFPGRFGWGYDGVNLFAPTRLYGRPDDFRRFVDKAHALNLGVILDVVYNHLGPDGNYLSRFSPNYFTSRYQCEWGEAVNFDGRHAENVREYFLTNAAYWIREFHLDGLRIDATQQIFDSSPEHIIAAVSRRVRKSAGARSTIILGENEPQKIIHILPHDQGGYGLDALWNDDFHHSAMAAMTGRTDAYYSDYRGTPQEFVSSLKWGFLYQGQWYSWHKQVRGTPSLNVPPGKFVNFIQNHDQVANSGSGKRCHLLTSPSRYRAITALFLLAPQTPMLFQGQEFAASSPFFYFADHKDEIARFVAQGRAGFLSQFRALASPNIQARLPDPGNPMTFVQSKLNHGERTTHAEEYALHCDLLKLRREDPGMRNRTRGEVDGAIIGPEAFVIRYFGQKTEDRILIVNLGRDLCLHIAPEPLLAPPAGKVWVLSWTSEDPRYGGTSTPPWPTEGEWNIQGEAAIILHPVKMEE
jgi:maltooligosyltrehalose trehalohydrolase